ncbi:hypothetical protein [Floridanema aerugineum]|uniref:Uncharacterized protein n=1 Tax=Floridaenema aerugineum BLCC-F46 TaxID=3153654 RepID=A0ABV4X2U3_9CYAN
MSNIPNRRLSERLIEILKRWRYFRRLAKEVFIAFGCFLALGFIFLILSIVLPIPSLIRDILLSFSSTFLSSAILTLTLETFNSLQSQNDRDDLSKAIQNKQDDLFTNIDTKFTKVIEQINSKTIEMIIQSTIGSQAIYEQIQNQIISKKYLREEMQNKLTLKWYEDDKEYLQLTYETISTLRSLSDQDIDKYEFKHFLEKQSENKFPGNSKIMSILADVYNASNERQEGKGFSLNKTIELNNFIEKKPRLITFLKEIELPARGRIKSKIIDQVIMKKDNIFPIYCSHCTLNMNIEIDYPEDLVVTGYAIHPSRLEEYDVEGIRRKIFIINTALLPMQGIAVQWYPSTNVDS